MDTLDDFDRKILNALQRDGRMTSHELAEATALSPSQCARRRRRLEELGIIKSYRACLSRRKVGLGVSAFVQVSLNNHQHDDIDAFLRLLELNPRILEACKLTGPTDFLLRVATADLDEMNHLISQVLLPHPSVSHVQSHVVLEWLKEDSLLPLAI
ncbi:MAG: Lrp/AsnC family transcriptional regulator [Alphaproteobacteria bacterium]|jgi:DNA-binding Lrp family transcriptional regulator|nr:Lrp/AsnC family transcriptional regulator [Alphaproteobacteria bacterium]